MNQSCYAYEGVLRCVVFASNETESITLCDLFCTVRSGIPTQIVDPDEVIPDVESLLTIEKKIEAALKNTDSAVANAQELVDTVQKKLDNG